MTFIVLHNRILKLKIAYAIMLTGKKKSIVHGNKETNPPTVLPYS
jgi:hypothetical protein